MFHTASVLDSCEWVLKVVFSYSVSQSFGFRLVGKGLSAARTRSLTLGGPFWELFLRVRDRTRCLHSQLRCVNNYELIGITILILAWRGVPRNHFFVLPKLPYWTRSGEKRLPPGRRASREKSYGLRKNHPRRFESQKYRTSFFHFLAKYPF